MDEIMHWIIFCISLIFHIGVTEGSHFRGAIITWKPGPNENEIIIDYRISWRLSYSSRHYCDDNTILTGDELGGGSDTIECFSGCDVVIGTLTYQCTDYNVVEDWTSGKGSMTMDHLQNLQNSSFLFGFSGAAWISTLEVGADSDWRLQVWANVSVRADIGRMNTAPGAEITPIVRLQQGCNHTLTVPVHDDDNDVIRCRWSKHESNECGGVCNGLPGSILDGDQCTLSYNAVNNTGWYAVAIQVEDFIDVNSHTPLSSIPVQFLVQVYSGNDSCVKSVVFIPPTPPDDACIGVSYNTSWESAIVTRVANENSTLSIKTISPLGMTKSGHYKISSVDWRMNISWSPDRAGGTITNVFCFTSIVSTGRESERRCITLLAGVESPAFVNQTQTPTNIVNPQQREWSVALNTTDVTQTSRSTYIRLFNSNGTLVEQIDASDRVKVTVDHINRLFTFVTTVNMVEKQFYYFLFDFGIIKGTSYCGPESESITDPNFWRFRIRDVTPPKISVDNNRLVTNATTEIKWSINEPVFNTTCTVKELNHPPETSLCNDRWFANNLTEGSYTLTIHATDLDKNFASFVHSWTVDTTPPDVEFVRTPSTFSNERNVHVEWVCSEDCISSVTLDGATTTHSNGNEASFSLLSTVSNKTYTIYLEVRDEVWNTAAINVTWVTDFIPPVIKLCDGGDSMTVDCYKDFLPSTVCNVSAIDNMDPSPNIWYKDSNTGSCGFTRTWTSNDSAGNNAVKTQTFSITTPGSLSVTRSPPPMSIACGSLSNMTDIFISMFEVKHPCNLKTKFIYVDNTQESCDVSIERTWTISDDCNTTFCAKQYIKVQQAQLPLFPENGQVGIDLNIELRWSGPSSDINYNIYVWLYGTKRPHQTFTVVTEPFYDVNNLKPGTKYLWQVVYQYLQRNDTYLSPVWAFETRFFADLVVESIDIPKKGFTGETYEIKWTVVNKGIATQTYYWYDAVYMSWGSDFRSSTLIARVRQRNIILSNDGYSSTAQFTLDKKQIGNARFFVVVDYSKYLNEYNTTNNFRRSSSTMHVVLTPPPDLQVTSITLSGTTFYSGNVVELTWTVANLGEGSTRHGSWTDSIFLSQNSNMTNEAKLLRYYRQNGNIGKDVTVTMTTHVTLPEFQAGNFFFIVEVDTFNDVFEYAGENNNIFSMQNPFRVILTPPPDLVVTSIDTGGNIWTTGDTKIITWRVENEGYDTPRSQTYWTDRMEITDKSGSWNRFAGTRAHYGSFGNSDRYELSLSFYVHANMPTGNYNISVHTDFYNNLFEYIHEDNNILVSNVKVEQALPDLNLKSFTVYVVNEPNSTMLHARWTVENNGKGKTLTSTWFDSIFIKYGQNQHFNLLSEIPISNNNYLDPRQSYSRNISLYLPLTIYGSISLMARSDSYRASGDNTPSNNIYTIPSVDIDLRAVDMVLKHLEIRQNFEGEKSLQITYTVSNAGNRNIENETWTDLIYVSQSLENRVPFRNILESILWKTSLKVNDTYVKTVILQLPLNISGPYYIVVKTNANNNIFEGGRFSNNILHKLVEIAISPAIDLFIESLSVIDKGNVNGDKILRVSWIVQNIGNSMTKVQTWFDKVYVTDNRLGNDNSVDLAEYEIENRLNAQGSYEISRNTILPIGVQGNIYVCVEVDTTDTLYESISKGNNKKCDTTPLYVKPSQGAKLIGIIRNITALDGNDIVAPGTKMVIECDVMNIGDRMTSKSSWVDAIYIANAQVSTSKQLRDIGIKVKENVHLGSLRPNDDYNFSTNFMIPYDFNGQPAYYLIADDVSSGELDWSGTNSIGEPGSRPDNSSSTVVSVKSYLSALQISYILPNLVVNSSMVLPSMNGGNPVTLEYNVTNFGNITTYQVWYDSVYISEDFIIDAFDKKLKSELRSLQLDPQETVPMNISFLLPLDLPTKSYILAIVIDSRNDVFEEREDDNTLRMSFDMSARASTDLMVKQVFTPTFVEYGSEMTVSWEIANNGSKQATGYKCDSVYLSGDSKWDITDHLLGKATCSLFTLAPNQTQVIQENISSKVPQIKAHNYTALVKSRSNIIDVLPENNVGEADKRTEISYRLLKLGQLTHVNLSEHESIAFRIPTVVEDYTIVINVSSSNHEAFNMVYIKSGSPATLYDFDQMSNNPSSANHVLTVPDTVKGDYYIMVENSGFISGTGKQILHIIIKYARLEVMTVSPGKLLTGSQTTLHLTGTLFPTDMKAELHFGDASMESISAISTWVFSSTDAYATFSLSASLSPANASLVLIYNERKSTLITNISLQVGAGTEGYLSTSLDNLGRFRVWAIGVVTLNMYNGGESDLLSPILIVRGIGNGYIRLVDNNKEEMFQSQYMLIGSPDNGPNGLFPPATYGSFKFEVKPSFETRGSPMQLKVSTLTVSNEIPNPFIDQKNTLRPTHYDESDWEDIWRNFIKLTGNNTLTLSRKISLVLNEMSQAGRRVYKLDDIVNFLLEISDAPYGDRTLYQHDVFNVASKSSIELVVDFSLSARIGSRKQHGYLGNGWILPLWDTKIKKMDQSSLILTLLKEDYDFINVEESVFVHAKLGTITKVGSDMVLQRRLDDKEYHFDAVTLMLISIKSRSDGSYLNLKYADNKLTKIQHSTGAFVDIVYDDVGKIQSMELKNTTRSKEEKKTFIYDFDTGRLQGVRSKSGTVNFLYDSRHSSLKYVIHNEEEIQTAFEYNTFGHLASKSYIVRSENFLSYEYKYSGNGMVYIHEQPNDKRTAYTFGEDGTLLRVQTDNNLPEKTVATMLSRTTYLGDVMILKNTYDRDANQFIIEDGNGDKIKTRLNELGQLTEYIDGRGNKYQVELNENGTMKNVIYPDGTNKSYSYFNHGHTTTLQSGDVITYEFDNGHQLIKKTDDSNNVVFYEYDNDGNIVTATNEVGEINIENNVFGNRKLPSKINYPNHDIQFTYDSKDQVSAITTSNGYKVSYSYDRKGRMTQVTDENNGVLVDAKYDNAGRIIKKQLGNNAFTSYTYDSGTGLLTELLNYYPNRTLSSYFKYTYSTRNRRIAVDTIDGQWRFRYDRAGQVISMTDPSGNVTEYTYDESKNRKIVSVNGVDTSNVVNKMNQYTQYGRMKYKHDKNGNLIEKISENGEKEHFEYDNYNRLIGYTSSTNNCTYKYDGFGFLYSKMCNDFSTQYVVNMRGNYGVDVLQQMTNHNGLTEKISYYHGDDIIGLIAQKHNDGELNFFMFDPLGSVVSILDGNGDLLSKFERNPFGEQYSINNAAQSSLFSFVGQWGVLDMQEMPGTYLMRARLYDSYTGRFMNIDPLGVKAHSKNFYTYCSNDPVHFNDPAGECPWCALVGAVKGALTGLYDYTKNTPVADRTLGGAAGAGVTGLLKGALDPFRAVLPKPVEIFLDAGSTVIGNGLQHIIDKEPYSFRDANKDYVSSVVDDTIKYLEHKYKTFKIIVDGAAKACSVLKKFAGSAPENDILGPAGYGPANFIKKDLEMKYKIRFENSENATAPAQRVYIEHSYSEYLDPRTFSMNDFGFGNFTQKITDRRKFFQGTIDMTLEMGFIVRVFAGLDIVSKSLIWKFQTVDPTTGEAPIDPGIGFLPPNNGTSGQGYVSFSVKPRSDVKHLASINANASIYFDENEPIDTPNIFHTIDDEAPILNGSVIPETVSVDSTTISLQSEDSGSGPAFVDIFKKQNDSLVMYKEHVTESILVIPVSPGVSYDLLPVPVDHVGNRYIVKDLDKIEYIHIASPVTSGNCSCSRTGYCTSRNVCICNEGYYGPLCSSSIKPSEPPVLAISAVSGFVDKPIELRISAINVSGLFEDINIIISGIPNATTFSKGTLKTDGTLILDSSEFGLVTMTTSFVGHVTLNVRAEQFSPDINATRLGDLVFNVYDQPNVNIELNGCFFNNSNNSLRVKLNSSVSIVGNSSLFTHNVQLIAPSWVSPLGESNTEHTYNVKDTVKNYILSVNMVHEFNVSIIVNIQYPGIPTQQFSQQRMILSYCNSDSIQVCKSSTTKWYVPLTKRCVCKTGWRGDICGTDINECNDTGICNAYSNTACLNKDGGYDCLCRVGYRNESNQCVAIEVSNNDTTTESPNNQKFSVSLRLDVELSPNANLEVAVSYNYYMQQAHDMLKLYYMKELGDNFVQLIILSLRPGSLIVDHEVIVRKNISSVQSMTAAMARLVDSNGLYLVLDGKPATVMEVDIDNSRVTSPDLCTLYTSINSCGETDCIVEDNKPICRPAEKKVKDHTVLILAVCLGISLFLLLIFVVIRCRSSGKTTVNKLSSSVVTHENPAFDR
ncbi:hypothetical protein ACF0H5_001671 [Mactra antiquata]